MFDKRVLTRPLVTWEPSESKVHFDYHEPFFVVCKVCGEKTEEPAQGGGRITMRAISKLVLCQGCFSIEVRSTSTGGEEDPNRGMT